MNPVGRFETAIVLPVGAVASRAQTALIPDVVVAFPAAYKGYKGFSFSNIPAV